MDTIEDVLTGGKLSNITEKAVVLLVTKHYLGTSKAIRSGSVAVAQNLDQASLDAIQALPAEEQPKLADTQWLSVSKLLLNNKAMNAIWALDDKLMSKLSPGGFLCLPSPLKGGRLVSMGCLAIVDKLLVDHAAERQKLVDTWCASNEYEKSIEEAKERLGELFNRDDYPPKEVVKEAFSFRWSYMQFGVSSGLEKISRELMLREQQKAEEQWKMVGDEVQQLLRGSMNELVSHLVDKLSPAEDGKKKVFRASNLDNIASFLETFQARNITDDLELNAVVEKVRELTKGVSVDSIKSSDSLRESMQKGFTEIKESLDTMIESGPRRKVKFA